MEKKRQDRILEWISRHVAPASASVLEVGVGSGLFAEACRKQGWKYVGVERNESIALALRPDHKVVVGEVPPLPDEIESESFDLAYSAFVFEHLADGIEGFHFVQELHRVLKPGGVLTLIVPDALSLGMEFWSLDYTHRYPTTERNVTQILLECGLRIERCARYRGAGWTGLRYALARAASWFYSYRFWQWALGKKDLPYSVFQYLNQDILVFICRKPLPEPIETAS
jgi:SAM-dependent methyltransferase